MKNLKNKPIKKLLISYKKITGKNNLGKIVFFHRGGGVKKNFRVVDFKKKFNNIFGLVRRVEYNPLQKSGLMLINYLNGILVYNLLMKGIKLGHIINDYSADLNFGSTYYLNQIPNGCFISQIELDYNKGLQLVRSPGSKALLLGKEKGIALIKLPSGKIKKFTTNCRALIGILALNFKKLIRRKAGTNVLNNLKPIVRGVAMNPIDHPHGGGQGKTSGGRKMSVSPWSKYTKGLKPQKKRKKLNYLI